MPVPLLDVNAQNLPLAAELQETFARVLHSGQFILGQEVTAFEDEVAQLCGVKHAIGVTSGTDAILLALMTLGIGPGDEVITPSFTFFATAGCVSRAGATPVFVDSCPQCFNINPDHLAAKITSRTKAIIPVHLFGQPAEMDRILEIASARNIPVIEDAAQSMGALYKGRSCGSMGDFGAFSFFPSKNLGGFGDGGMLVCNDDALAEKARLLRVHGSKPKYYHKHVGANFRIDALQAALLRVKLRHFSSYNAKRASNAGYYLERLAKLPGVALPSQSSSCPSEVDEARLILPSARLDVEHIWNQFTFRLTRAGERDALHRFLLERKIGNEIYYPVPLHKQECFANVQTGALPIAEKLASQVLSIPVYPELTRAQQDEVIGAIGDFLST
ncbi:MAG TPA: DegT/DnrJ/EryC1/StrS family aminotransferase [Methylomirabilota bacterium]|nr:DegT/DnrJ/EryC1/StrS family aminotransferase [Methylomirabilota bacterium]